MENEKKEMITKESLHEFIMNDENIKKMDKYVILKNNNDRNIVELKEINEKLINFHLKNLQHLEIFKIEDLSEIYMNNLDSITIRIEKPYGRISGVVRDGLSLFYLYQVLVSKYTDKNDILNYIREMGFEFPENWKFLLNYFEKLANELK
ncbi:MAG: hypothetical protein PF638_14595 [Candidatus Delongbacteria bacterium]|jgi:hypothetical protein|nr:hypothetical protein [Candidatus Delongbacteria bacterium]